MHYIQFNKRSALIVRQDLSTNLRSWSKVLKYNEGDELSAPVGLAIRANDDSEVVVLARKTDLNNHEHFEKKAFVFARSSDLSI